MINLFDSCDSGSLDLYHSLTAAGYKNKTIVVNDDGFLPEGFQSPYSFFTGSYNRTGLPKSFYQLKVPDQWEIKADNESAAVYDEDMKRADIEYYRPLALHRIVKSVAWLDRRGKRRSIDFYNRCGFRFSQTVCAADGQEIFTSYFDGDGREVITENHQTANLILDWHGKTMIFDSKTDFLDFYFAASKTPLDKIVYNSLSTPMLFSYGLDVSGADTLFWQEKLQNGAIPGNMQVILNDDQQRTKKIVFQNRDDYDFMQKNYQGHGKEKIEYLSFIYPQTRENLHRPKALILTDSDQIQNLKELVVSLPEVVFSIAALTEMSPKLMGMANYKNVRLFPNAGSMTIKRLWQDNDLYLDINHGSEIVAAVRQAFLQDQLIFAFEGTCHDRSYLLDQFIYADAEVNKMVEDISKTIEDPNTFSDLLGAQRKKKAGSVPGDYQKILN